MSQVATPLLTIERVIAEVAAEAGLTVADLIGASRVGKISRPRHEAMRRCRAVRGRLGGPRWSYPQIGRAFNRHWATVILGERRAIERLGAGA